MRAPTFRKGRVLVAYMAELDAMNFLRGTCVVEHENENEIYRAKWKAATESVRGAAATLLVPPKQKEPSQDQQVYLRELFSQEVFKQMMVPGNVVREIEIGKVIAFQRHLDTEYADELASKMKENQRFVFELCLPLKFEQALDVTFDQAVAGVTFSSLSPKLVPQGMHIFGLGGPIVSIGDQRLQQPGVVFLIGTQLNYVQVVEYQSRFFLKNGYHRAYAALLAGLEYVPAIISKVDDFVQTGAVNPAFFPRQLLMSDKPPVMSDFLSPALTAEVKLRSMRKTLRVRMDEFFVPL